MADHWRTQVSATPHGCLRTRSVHTLHGCVHILSAGQHHKAPGRPLHTRHHVCYGELMPTCSSGVRQVFGLSLSSVSAQCNSLWVVLLQVSEAFIAWALQFAVLKGLLYTMGASSAVPWLEAAAYAGYPFVSTCVTMIVRMTLGELHLL